MPGAPFVAKPCSGRSKARSPFPCLPSQGALGREVTEKDLWTFIRNASTMIPPVPYLEPSIPDSIHSLQKEPQIGLPPKHVGLLSAKGTGRSVVTSPTDATLRMPNGPRACFNRGTAPRHATLLGDHGMCGSPTTTRGLHCRWTYGYVIVTIVIVCSFFHHMLGGGDISPISLPFQP